MNNHLLLSALRARYRVLLFIIAITISVTAVVSLLLPKTYVASAAMLVDSKADQSMNASSDTHVRERIGYMQTQVDLITSQKVAHKVVTMLGLASLPESRVVLKDAFEGEDSIDDRLTEILLKRLKVDTSQSSVINIAFPSSDANFSALIANAFSRAYLDTALELQVEPSRKTAAWFEEQITSLRNNLEQALVRLTEYQREKGIVTPDERLEADNSVTQGRAYSMTRLARPISTAGTGESIATTQHLKARADLQRAEAKLRELAIRFGENHPVYQRQFSETQTLREVASKTVDQSLQQTQRREAELRDAVAAQQSRVAELRNYRNQVGVLMRDVDIAQKAYETAMQRSVDKKVESRASLTNVSILNAAAVPFKPARPRVGLNIALSAIVGILLGLCTIYLMEMFDRRVRSGGDLDNEWHVPLLAELHSWEPAQARLPGRPGLGKLLPGPG